MDEENILKVDMQKYISPVVVCPALSVMMICSHELTLQRAAGLKALMAQLGLKVSCYELKKPFIIAYWESFGRVV